MPDLQLLTLVKLLRPSLKLSYPQIVLKNFY